MLISFLSFDRGIERREGLGLYYHTLWREGQGHGRRIGVMKVEERVWAVYNHYVEKIVRWL